MVKGSPLRALLRRIRRRVRLFAALEGGIWGGAVAAAALAAGIAIVRRRGGAPAPDGATLSVLLAGTGVLVGAIVRAARPIPLARCARIADAAIDGQDRVLSAFSLEADAASPLVAALVADAIGAAGRLAPGGAVPAGRPRGLAALGLTAIALGVAVLFPVSSRAARSCGSVPIAARRPPLATGAIDVEREEVRAALGEAARDGDQRLAALAAEFDRTLRDLSSGTLGEGQALESLRALQERAAEAARAAERDRRAADAAARALDANGATRAAGQALTAADDGASERARAALGASAAAQPAETGRALTAAARGVAQASSETGAAAPEPGRRRLARDPAGPEAGQDRPRTAAGEPETRRLEQLRRDLDEASAACRDGDPSCRARAENRAQDLALLGRRAAAANGLRRLERAAGQLRARAARGELREGDTAAARNFGRAANGETPDPRAGGEGKDQGDPLGANDPGSFAGPSASGDSGGNGSGDRDDSGSGAGAAAQADALSRGEGSAQSSDGTGDGIGRQPGGAPLGHRTDVSSPSNQTEARVADGAGPSRAEVIGAAAGRGFVARDYARVFTAYTAAVEDALGTTAVPEGKRFIVRRYFDLIRPRGAR